MKLFCLIGLLLVAAVLFDGREVSPQDDAPAGLVVVKVKRDYRREQPTDVRNTATSPDALQNTGMRLSIIGLLRSLGKKWIRADEFALAQA